MVVVDTAERSGSTPSVARRSASGSSESSRTRAGNVPSARPQTNTRSRSSPRPSATWPMRMPVAEAADAPEVGVELELERAAEHVEAGGGLDRVEPGEAIERRLDLVGRLLLRVGPARRGARSCARKSRTSRCAHADSSRQLAPGARRRRARRAARRRRRRGRAPRRARARTSRDAARGRAPPAPRPAWPPARGAWRSSRSCHCVAPRDDAGPAADALPACRRHRRRPRNQTGAPASSAITSWRWKSRSGSASRPSTDRPSTLSASVRTAAPLCGMPAAASCSCTSAGVRLGGAVEDRHALERHAVDERRHHEPDHGAHFVVGIGRRHDLGAVRRLDASPPHRARGRRRAARARRRCRRRRAPRR